MSRTRTWPGHSGTPLQSPSSEEKKAKHATSQIERLRYEDLRVMNCCGACWNLAETNIKVKSMTTWSDATTTSSSTCQTDRENHQNITWTSHNIKQHPSRQQNRIIVVKITIWVVARRRLAEHEEAPLLKISFHNSSSINGTSWNIHHQGKGTPSRHDRDTGTLQKQLPKPAWPKWSSRFWHSSCPRQFKWV